MVMRKKQKNQGKKKQGVMHLTKGTRDEELQLMKVLLRMEEGLEKDQGMKKQLMRKKRGVGEALRKD